MARKKPPPGNGRPDYGPEPPAREELGDDNPRIDEHEPERNRSAPFVAVLITVILVIAFAAFYFLTRGGQ